MRSLGVQLILGAEIFLTPSLPEKLKDDPTFIIKYGSKKYVLVELPFYQYPIYTEEVLFNLLTERIIPVVAHPERYLYLERNIKIIKKWMKNEILLQINTGSLNGQYGMQVKRFARRLLKNGLVHFIGSDVHSIDDNSLALSKGIKIASRLAGEDMIRPIYNSFSNGDL